MCSVLLKYNIPLYECQNGTQSPKTTTEFNATMFEITKHYTTLTSTSTPRLTGTVFMTLPSTKTSTKKLTDAITTPVPTSTYFNYSQTLKCLNKTYHVMKKIILKPIKE